MNKKYTEFTAGTYNAAKIFLQADPVTGQLSKIPLSSIPAGSPIIKTFTSPSTNQTAGFSNHYTYNIPANKFVNSGDSLEIEYYGTSGASGQNKGIANIFGNEGVAWSDFILPNNWFVKSKYVRNGTDQLITAHEAQNGNNITEIVNTTFTSIDFSQPIETYIRLNGQIAFVINVIFATIKFYQGDN
jgi:hypothetical protein